MTDKPAFFQVISEETSFKRVNGPTGQEALEVTIESIIKSMAGVTETRTQAFALAGEQAVKLTAALQTITENMINLVDKSTEEVKRRYDEASIEDTEEVTEDTEEVTEDTEEVTEDTVEEKVEAAVDE